MNKRFLMAAPALLAAAAAITGCKPINAKATAFNEGPACVKHLSSSQRHKLKLSSEQADNAYVIASVAAERDMGERGAVVGVATGLQESNLKRSAVGDGGLAIGVFQQHPSWGSDRTNTRTAAARFFSRLKKVDGWKYLPLTVAAQRVQISGYPDGYAKHEGRAQKIVNAMWKGC